MERKIYYNLEPAVHPQKLTTWPNCPLSMKQTKKAKYFCYLTHYHTGFSIKEEQIFNNWMHLEMWEYAQRELNAARGVTLIAPCLSIMFILLLYHHLFIYHVYLLPSKHMKFLNIFLSGMWKISVLTQRICVSMFQDTAGNRRKVSDYLADF